MVASLTTISCDFDHLSYERACDIANRALLVDGQGPIQIGLNHVANTTTAALARLIALRCNLRKSGRDLRITGLHGQAEHLYVFNRMTSILPRDAGVDAPLMEYPGEITEPAQEADPKCVSGDEQAESNPQNRKDRNMTIRPKHRAGFTLTDILVALTIVTAIVTAFAPKLV